MAPRRRKARRRGRAAFSLINALESLGYAEIMSRGIAGNSVFGLITGKSDIRAPAAGYAGPMTFVNPDQKVSLSEIIESPSLAIDAMQQNFNKNLVPMAMQALTLSVSARLGKRLLRRPISNVNRNIMKPLFGGGASGVKL
tara:strand:+ start:176 stop:598 length:423 start_codon:yes stop_codon:yes gene_type:complete